MHCQSHPIKPCSINVLEKLLPNHSCFKTRVDSSSMRYDAVIVINNSSFIKIKIVQTGIIENAHLKN